MHIWSRLALLTLAVVSSQSYARFPELPQPQKSPVGLTIADWSAIRAEYDRHRRGFFPVVGEHDGEYHARSYTQQWLAKFDGRGFEVKPNEESWTWGLQLASYGFAGSERSIEDQATMSHDVDHASYKWNSEIEEWFVNESQGLEHGFTIEKPPGHPNGPLTLHLNIRGGFTAQADGRSATFLDRDGTPRITYSNLQAIDARGRSLNARMLAESNGLRIEVEEASAVYPLRIDPIVQQAYLKASNTDSFDLFGRSVAISGDTVIVGADGEDSNATGINGNQSNNAGANSGAAYVFVRNGTDWSQQAYFKASNTDVNDSFGNSVAISGDTAIVGAFQEDSNATGVNGNQSNNSAAQAGAAYVFVRNGLEWSQQAYLKASNTDASDWFGASVAISGDTAIVGAYGEASNATGVNGDQTNNSAGFAGAAYVFVRNGTTWSQQAYLKASNTDSSDGFGVSVAISGDTAIVGAYGEDSNATGVNGNQSNNSAVESGAAYVFVRNSTAWSQQAYLKGSNTDAGDWFGWSVAVSGDTAIVGAPTGGTSAGNSGAAYVFVRSGVAWSPQADLKASNADIGDRLGYSVGILGDTAIVGAPWESSNATGVNGNQSNNSAVTSGAAYIFERDGTVWSQQAYLKASNTDAGDEFGISVAISGESFVVGAAGEDSNATGVNGNQSNNSAVVPGAAYVFTTTDTFDFVTSVSPAAPLRNASGWVGMHIAVGDAPLKVSALGRYCVAGNNQVHTVKLVSANTKNDVPNATASVNMAGCTPGQFVYADLAHTATLTPKARYYLVSQEVNGGDQWLELGPVTTNPGASVVGSVYFNNVSWITLGAAGTSYVPPSMKYEIQATPASSAFILSYNRDNRIQRNNFTGFAGMQLRIGASPLTVNSVGRGCIPGNSQTHLVKFVNASTGADVPGGSAVVNMAGCGTDFVYQALPSPIVLQANTTYYLVSSETAGGDKWTDQSQLTTSSDATVLTSIFSQGSGYAINEANAAYVPPNFLYTK